MPITTYGESLAIRLLSAAFLKQADEDWPPRNPDIPDLSQLHDGLIQGTALAAVFTGQLPRESKAFVLSVTFIRLVSESIITYQRFREKLVLYSASETSRFTNYMQAVSEGETLICTLRRACLYESTLRKNKNVPHLKASLTKSDLLTLSKMRNIIQHGEEMLIKEEVIVGLPLTLLLSNSQTIIGSFRFSYLQISELITQLHESATTLLHFRDIEP